jgi:hypothetical protein
LLYDDAGDPFQQRNLTEDSGRGVTKTGLAGMLREWLARTGDDFEAPEVVAERYIGNHDRNIVADPPPLEPAIREGQTARNALRRG